MGAEFLSDAQMAAFGRFRGVPSREQLERYFLLDDADQALVARRRGDQNRLGFSVKLTTVRFLGTFLVDPLDVPWVVVEFLAPIDLGACGEDDPTVGGQQADEGPTPEKVIQDCLNASVFSLSPAGCIGTNILNALEALEARNAFPY